MPTTYKRKIKGYGYRPDLSDHRDYLYAVPGEVLDTLPPAVDLRGGCGPVLDQGQLGSCTGNSIASALQFDQKKQGEADFTPSRLFIYYGEREVEGTTGQDSGAQIRDGIKVVAKQGAPPESDWPYDISKFAQKPPQQAYDEAAKYKAIKYARVAKTLTQLKGCLAAGYGFVFGFTVYESFESRQVAKTGFMPMPIRGERVLGGHAVHCVGYWDDARVFIIKNSWGTNWGAQGYFYMPQHYMTSSLASDFWKITLTS